jgi:hypothetical protein
VKPGGYAAVLLVTKTAGYVIDQAELSPKSFLQSLPTEKNATGITGREEKNLEKLECWILLAAVLKTSHWKPLIIVNTQHRKLS